MKDQIFQQDFHRILKEQRGIMVNICFWKTTLTLHYNYTLHKNKYCNNVNKSI